MFKKSLKISFSEQETVDDGLRNFTKQDSGVKINNYHA